MNYKKDEPEFQSTFNFAGLFNLKNASLIEDGHRFCISGQYQKWREVLFILERRLHPFYCDDKADWVKRVQELRTNIYDSFKKYGGLKKKQKELKDDFFQDENTEIDIKVQLRKTWGEIYRALDDFERFVLYIARRLDLLLPEKTSSSYFGN